MGNEQDDAILLGETVGEQVVNLGFSGAKGNNWSSNLGYSTPLTNTDGNGYLTLHATTGISSQAKDDHHANSYKLGVDIAGTQYVSDNVFLHGSVGVSENYTHTYDQKSGSTKLDTVIDITGKPHLAYVTNERYSKENSTHTWTTDLNTNLSIGTVVADDNIFSAGVKYTKELSGSKDSVVTPHASYTRLGSIGEYDCRFGAEVGYRNNLQNRTINPNLKSGMYAGISFGVAF